MSTDAAELERRTAIEHYRRHLNAGMARVFELMSSPLEVRSEGAYVYDHLGKQYLDCSGYCVFLLGHRHPAVIAAVTEQLGRHPLASRVMVDPVVARAASTLASVAPQGLEYVCFANSGAEAVELGLKLARLHGCTTTIAATGGFHGKTTGALAVSGRERYRRPFEPLLAGIERVSFGDADELAGRLVSAPSRCAVLLEPLQSEAGVLLPPDGYLAEVRALCDRHGALLVFDEISTGLGRTGSWWCAGDVRPDVLLAGKALSGGVIPTAAVISTPAVFAPLSRDPLLHTSTFAGNPLAAAAATATIETIRREGIVERARTIGERLRAAIVGMLDEQPSPLVRAVRGRGLLLGIELAEEHHAAELLLELVRRRVLVSHSLNAHPVVRLTPPAILSEDDEIWLLGALREALGVVTHRYEGSTGATQA
jgi:putrescine aminotransferase